MNKDQSARRKRMTHPRTNEEIDITNYKKLVIKVFNNLVLKFGPWLHRHKEDLVQSGQIGLIKAKEKYEPGRGSFLGLAYLRITSAMQNEIAKYAKYESNVCHLEEIKNVTNGEDAHKLSWDEMFGSDFIDYPALIRMVDDEDDRKLLLGIIEMYPYWKLRNILKESKEDHELRVSRLKKDMKEYLEILHPNI